MSAKADQLRNRLSINPDEPPPAPQRRADTKTGEPEKPTATGGAAAAEVAAPAKRSATAGERPEAERRPGRARRPRHPRRAQELPQLLHRRRSLRPLPRRDPLVIPPPRRRR